MFHTKICSRLPNLWTHHDIVISPKCFCQLMCSKTANVAFSILGSSTASQTLPKHGKRLNLYEKCLSRDKINVQSIEHAFMETLRDCYSFNLFVR